MVNGSPGVAPQTAKRNEFTRLIAEGLSIAEAARRMGSTTGRDGGGCEAGRCGCPPEWPITMPR